MGRIGNPTYADGDSEPGVKEVQEGPKGRSDEEVGEDDGGEGAVWRWFDRVARHYLLIFTIFFGQVRLHGYGFDS